MSFEDQMDVSNDIDWWYFRSTQMVRIEWVIVKTKSILLYPNGRLMWYYMVLYFTENARGHIIRHLAEALTIISSDG